MRGRSRPACLLVLLLAALGLASCRGKKATEPARLRVVRIEATERSAPPERVAGVDAAALRAWLRERLRRAPEVRLDEDGQPAAGAYKLLLELGIGERGAAEGETPGRVVVASLRGEALGGEGATGEGIALQASTVKPFPEGAGAGGVRHVVDALTDDVLYQARLVIGPPAKLVQALGDGKDTARLAAAVEIAGLRRAREAVPALVQLLRHEDEQVSDRAIGALVAIGDRSAVKPLTRLSSFQDTARMAKVLDAIGSLGGQEARDYLEFVSSGHEDADIRNLAAEALERMNRGTGAR